MTNFCGQHCTVSYCGIFIQSRAQMMVVLVVSASLNFDVNDIVTLLFSRMILQKEGPRSLFRGLGPNLVGVAPSR